MAENLDDSIDPAMKDFELSYSVDAPAINRFYVALGQTGLRISFAEQTPAGKQYFRNAVTMHPQDGVELYKLLKEVLKETEVELDKVKEAQESDIQNV